MRIVLPVVYSSITTLPQLANILSIIEARQDECITWYADHFIQLVAVKNDAGEKLNMGYFFDYFQQNRSPFSTCVPFIEMYRSDRWIRIMPDRDFTEYAEYMLNNGRYINVCLDWYHIPHKTQFYRKKNYVHSTFIYGYDRTQKIFYVADFYRNNKYSQETITYDELNRAFYEGRVVDDDPFYKKIIATYKYVNYSYKMQIPLIKHSINDYVNGTDHLNKFLHDYHLGNVVFAYGIDYYEVLKCMIQAGGIGVHDFHLLCDYKNAMKIRIAYLNEIGLLAEKGNNKLQKMLEVVCNDTIIFRNLAIKAVCAPSASKQKRLIDRCEDLKLKDKRLFAHLLEIIK